MLMEKTMRKIPENNSLKKEIKKLLALCKKDEKNGGGKTYFDAPVSEEEMTEWEERNGVIIPELYKEWLRFSGKCQIAGNTAAFWGPSEFHSDYVPSDMVVIGEIFGDGEMVCFSKNEDVFACVFEGQTTELSDFACVLKKIIRSMDDKPILSDERYREIMKKLQEKREREAEKGTL